MASKKAVLASDPAAALEIPAVEVVDLATDDEAVAEQESEDESVTSGAWESISLYEDVFEGMGDEQFSSEGIDVCSLQEAMAFRKLLRSVGDDEFISRTIEAQTITAKKLCTAFGILPPAFLEGAQDSAYYKLLGLGIERELQKRTELSQYNSIDDAVSLLKSSKNIVLLTGAGISTSLGIPDFRSKHTGLYSQLEHLGLTDPQEVFDISLFREDPTIFYSVAKDILPTSKRFSPTHAFIRLVQDKGKLLTNFTQNIDNLEGHAGISREKLIQCHGSFATATCQQCQHKVKGEDLYDDLKAGKVARCTACVTRLKLELPALGMKRKRSSNGQSSKSKRRADYEDSSEDEEDYGMAVAGVMKPDITFFGEDLPAQFHDRLTDHDKDKVDLVIVIGTSLKVAPVAEIPNFFSANVPQIYISRDPCTHIEFDIELMGDCDVVVSELCKRAGWNLEHEMVPKGQSVDVQPVEGYTSRWTFKAKDVSEVPIEESTEHSTENAIDALTSAGTACSKDISDTTTKEAPRIQEVR